MELFLNFLWVLIAVFAFGIWRVCWMPQRSGRRDALCEWTAFVAALVFLFFAVSLTDDLHSNLVLFEESAGGRRQAMALSVLHASPHDANGFSVSPVAFVRRFTLPLRFHAIACVAIACQLAFPPIAGDPPTGRAPPSFFL